MKHSPLTIRPESLFADGKEWVPKEYADQLADALREKQRTQASHNHQFAAIDDLFENLTAEHARKPWAKSAEAFRKHALIETGHCDAGVIVCASDEDARRSQPMVEHMARMAHGYAIVTAQGNVITCFTPHSQSYKAMGKDRFKKSKADVLEWAQRILGVEL